jgi:hypothetical protein
MNFPIDGGGVSDNRWHEIIDDIVRALIAAIVLLGGGYAILSGNGHAGEVTALMGVVVGYYYNPFKRPAPASNGNGNGNGKTPAGAKA